MLLCFEKESGVWSGELAFVWIDRSGAPLLKLELLPFCEPIERSCYCSAREFDST